MEFTATFGLDLFEVSRLAKKQNSNYVCITVNGHQGSILGGRCFVLLNTFINKKPFFFSEVVTNKKGHPFPGGHIIASSAFL